MTQDLTLPFVARLVALHDDVQETEYLLVNDYYTIGRIPYICDIVINRMTVSREHAKIERRGFYFVLRNLSRYQTYIAGYPIEGEHILANGDKIGFSDTCPLLGFSDSNPTVKPGEIVKPEEILHYDAQRMSFSLEGKLLDLPPAQLRLFYHLYLHRGQLCNRESCAKAVWPEDEPSGRDTDLHRLIYLLRRQLGGQNRKLIENQSGRGYVLDW